MTTILIWWLAFGSYLLFAGTASSDELGTAGVLATLAVVWASAIRAVSNERYAASRRQVAPALRAIAALFPATMRTGLVLVAAAVRPGQAGSAGRARRSRFSAGAEDHALDRSRRALAVLFASLAPNRFVVAAEGRRGEVLLHELGPRPAEPDPQWLI